MNGSVVRTVFRGWSMTADGRRVSELETTSLASVEYASSTLQARWYGARPEAPPPLDSARSRPIVAPWADRVKWGRSLSAYAHGKQWKGLTAKFQVIEDAAEVSDARLARVTPTTICPSRSTHVVPQRGQQRRTGIIECRERVRVG